MRTYLSVVAAVAALSGAGAASASAAHLTKLPGRATWVSQLDAGPSQVALTSRRLLFRGGPGASTRAWTMALPGA